VQLSENASRPETWHRPPALRARHDASMLKAKQSADPLEEAAEDTPRARQAEARASDKAAARDLLTGVGETPREVLISTAACEDTGAEEIANLAEDALDRRVDEFCDNRLSKVRQRLLHRRRAQEMPVTEVSIARSTGATKSSHAFLFASASLVSSAWTSPTYFS
jgi:hypothetical protein